MSKKTGVYKITCIANGKNRVGHAGNIIKRWSQYLAELRDNKYAIPEMQQDFNLYGEDAFEIEVLERCPKYKCKERENYYIVLYDAIENGYNEKMNDLSKKKKIRRGREAKKFREMRSEMTSGENNGHCTKLCRESVFDILNMVEVGIDRKVIAEKYDIYPNYIGRLGKDRWIKAYNEWLKEKEATTAIVASSFALDGLQAANTNI